ncbi:hypothetical protein KUCAC02_032486 [Chaenocephalus aceratus]|nr:hypothetical protein KUCAC02_032486 [Chaenocephalus aceratus]
MGCQSRHTELRCAVAPSGGHVLLLQAHISSVTQTIKATHKGWTDPEFDFYLIRCQRSSRLR